MKKMKTIFDNDEDDEKEVEKVNTDMDAILSQPVYEEEPVKVASTSKIEFEFNETSKTIDSGTKK